MPYRNRHYITIDTRGCITDGWSDGPNPGGDTTKAICINENGLYQFRLFPSGEENPPLTNEEGIPLYKWVEGQVVPRTEEEIAADYVEPEGEAPTAQERLEAQVAYTAMMTDTLPEEG